jgi:hypothetical protein
VRGVRGGVVWCGVVWCGGVVMWCVGWGVVGCGGVWWCGDLVWCGDVVCGVRGDLCSLFAQFHFVSLSVITH